MLRSLYLVAVVSLVGCSSVQEKPEPTPLQRINAVVEFDVVESISLGGGDQTGLAPAVQGEVIAAASASGQVYLLNSELDELWDVELDRAIMGGASLNSTNVYVVTSDATLVALARDDGAKVFEVLLPSSATVPPVTTDSLVFVKTQIGRILAINAQTGEIVWVEEVKESGVGIRGGSPMTLEGDTLFVLWGSGRIFAYQADSGRIMWERQVAVSRGRSPLERIVDSKGVPSVRNNYVATATRNGQVSLLDARNGQLIWSLDSDAYPGALLAFNSVIVVETDGTVSAYSAQSGESLWSNAALKHREPSAPVVIDDFVAVVDLEGELHVFAPATGAIVGRVDIGGEKGQVAPVVSDFGVLVQLLDGRLSLVEVIR
ncbi:MAG: hypothetical protein CMD99_06190 [Gammaproteobacteria bacterium]|nr:hypothetical protein [Gammaproteobacteria bacterium]|tara:strand:+ start:3219 stop:4340 length:1122 start_codon:yes stop_codon:yes gene_type:complete